jgi:ribosomal protein L44E
MSSDKENGLGKEVLSYCGKCKQPTNHIVTTLNKKGVVDKCECQTCKAVHKYRDPDKPVKKRATKSTKKADVEPEVIWSEVMSAAKGPSKPYKMSAEFAKGDLIDHPMFGRGVVEELIDANKIKVVFEESGKLLAHNRK